MVFSCAFLVGLENTVFHPDGELPGPVDGVALFFFDADSGLSCLVTVIFTVFKDGMAILFASVSEDSDFHSFFPSLSVTVFLQVCFT